VYLLSLSLLLLRCTGKGVFFDVWYDLAILFFLHFMVLVDLLRFLTYPKPLESEPFSLRAYSRYIFWMLFFCSDACAGSESSLSFWNPQFWMALHFPGAW
jgi:hypothetical protein